MNQFEIPPSPRRRAGLAAPLLTAAAALVVGAVLLVAIARRDDGSIAIGDSGTTIPSTGPPAATSADGSVDGSVDESGDGSGTSVPATDATSTSTTDGSDVEPSMPARQLGPPAEATVRIDGETFIRTYACVSFPLSNPDAGIGDAHVNSGLHLVESVTGDRALVELRHFDAATGLGVTILGGASGSLEVIEPTATSFEVTFDDGTTRTIELGSLQVATTCNTLISSDSADPFTFTALGAVDSCYFDVPAPVEVLYTFEGGATLGLTDAEGVVTGELRHDGGTSEIVDGSSEVETGPFVYAGTLRPGFDIDEETFRFEIVGDLPSHLCTPAQQQMILGS